MTKKLSKIYIFNMSHHPLEEARWRPEY